MPYQELLNYNTNTPHPGCYPEEMLIRASKIFQICKNFSDEGRTKRNHKVNEKRDFKPIRTGDRVYIKRMIKRKKFDTKFYGPIRVTHIEGVTVFGYDLATGKKKGRFKWTDAAWQKAFLNKERIG